MDRSRANRGFSQHVDAFAQQARQFQDTQNAGQNRAQYQPQQHWAARHLRDGCTVMAVPASFTHAGRTENCPVICPS